MFVGEEERMCMEGGGEAVKLPKEESLASMCWSAAAGGGGR